MPHRTDSSRAHPGNVVLDRAMVVVLWLAFGYGVFGAILSIYVADTHGRPSMLRVGAVLVLLAGAAAAGLAQTQQSSTRR
ncbi:hypothetical protein ACOCJ5_11135 [Knoellia sp. CPCC 206450]|uniref:hypothetical protein n=1 Tax=Knoellia tibetensis TaxID=3404798 RepID=UPI003B43C5F7